MVTKHYCDKCGKGIDAQKDEFEEAFNMVSLEVEEEIKINKPELCEKCLKGYKKIIAEINKKIADYIKKD